MERVHFEQERMLVDLSDLVQRAIFTEEEVKQIIRKQTVFETLLVRRVAKKSDYLRYIAFESTLDALSKKRVQRLNIQGGCYAFVKRQNTIFERAVKKFKSDLGLWIEYINHAKSQGASTLVGRIAARALHLHPTTPSLYILLAAHEMEVNHSPDAARKILQRGLRINRDSGDLWVEYVKMELSFAEVVRRRRGVLGIDTDDLDGENEQEKLVHVVIKSALQNLNPQWRDKLRSMVAAYPIPDRIRDRLLVSFREGH